MASRKLGSTDIVHRGQVLGIFSTVDALRALSALSKEKRQLESLKTRKNQRTRP